MIRLKRRVFIFLSVLVPLLSITFVPNLRNYIISFFNGGEFEVVIGILSSPYNFDKRLSLRRTWLKLTSGISVPYYFIIGKHCHVHPEDRLSPYSCAESVLSMPQNTSSKTEFATLKLRNNAEFQCPTKLGYVGFGFYTLHDVTIKYLGVIKHFVKHAVTSFQVKLVSANTKQAVASVTISHHEILTESSDFIFKPIKPILLKKGFEAQVIVEFMPINYSLSVSCEGFEWNFIPGVINYIQLIKVGVKKPLPFQKESCSYALMKYAISDIEMVKFHISGTEERRNEWHNKQKNLLLQLENESNYYRDIVFLDVVDVYRNLPHKLILFFKRLMNKIKYFKYVLKTDDDSFIDVMRVYERIIHKERTDQKCRENSDTEGFVVRKSPLNLWWWSSYREFWKVQETGKWREDKFRSPGYPLFPCGGGYVLSRGIIEYLVKNSNNLQYFQGEDVSVGIWLSGLDTFHYYSDEWDLKGNHNRIQKMVIMDYGGKDRWNRFLKFLNASKIKLVTDFCEWTCDNINQYPIPLCNKVQLTVAEMYETWIKYIETGYI